MAGRPKTPRALGPVSRQDLLLSWFALPAAGIVSVLLGTLLMLAFGANPLTAYHALFTGAFVGSYALTSTAVKAVPLLLVGAGVCIAFRANMLNIGGEGQIAMGGLAATATALAVPGLPAVVLVPLVLLAGAVGGGIWGAIPGAFKAYFNVNEILSTIMLNLVAVQFMNYLLSGPLVAHSGYAVGGLIPQTALLSKNAWLPIIVAGTQLHLGVLIAILLAVAVWVLMWHTSLGFRIRAVGLSREASRYAGMSVKSTMTLAMTLAGALSGVAGAMLVVGSISHRMVTDGTLTGFTGNAGFNGIVVALFAGAEPALDDPHRVPLRRAAGGRNLDAGGYRRAFGPDNRLQRAGGRPRCLRRIPAPAGQGAARAGGTAGTGGPADRGAAASADKEVPA